MTSTGRFTLPSEENFAEKTKELAGTCGSRRPFVTPMARIWMRLCLLGQEDLQCVFPDSRA